MTIAAPNLYAVALVILSGAGCILCLIADEWAIETRIRLGIVLVMVCCFAILALYP